MSTLSTLEHRLKRLMLLRLLMTTTLLLVAAYVDAASQILFPINPLYFLIAGIYGLTLFYVLALRFLPGMHVQAYVQVVLDLVVITHFHADHVDGLSGAVRGRGRPPIVVSPLPEPAEQVKGLLATAASARLPVVTAVREMSGQAGAGEWAVHWRLLPPPSAARTVGSASSDADGAEINNSSVVVFAAVRGLRLMALGDVEPEAQRPLVRTVLGSVQSSTQSSAGSSTGSSTGGSAGTASGALAPVDVVVVAHHGSARQEPRLYRLLRPRVALIGVGADNDYDHPAPSALTLLRQVGALSLRTDRQGQLAVSGPSDRLRVMTSK